MRVVNPLPEGVVLHAVIDACHSGTAMDLQYYTKCRGGQFYWKDNYEVRRPSRNKVGINHPHSTVPSRLAQHFFVHTRTALTSSSTQKPWSPVWAVVSFTLHNHYLSFMSGGPYFHSALFGLPTAWLPQDHLCTCSLKSFLRRNEVVEIITLYQVQTGRI